jgi:hypothetical protein
MPGGTVGKRFAGLMFGMYVVYTSVVHRGKLTPYSPPKWNSKRGV